MRAIKYIIDSVPRIKKSIKIIEVGPRDGLQNEKQIITEKWNDFEQILRLNKFDIVIDGANIGFVNSKGSSELNIKFIQIKSNMV